MFHEGPRGFRRADLRHLPKDTHFFPPEGYTRVIIFGITGGFGLFSEDSGGLPGDYGGFRTAGTAGGGISAVAQGRVAAGSINILARQPEHWTKGMVLCVVVEFYAILSLLASIMMLLNIG